MGYTKTVEYIICAHLVGIIREFNCTTREKPALKRGYFFTFIIILIQVILYNFPICRLYFVLYTISI